MGIILTSHNEDSIPATSTIGEQHLLACPGCQAKVILFSCTIQTFCYFCGEAVTALDQNGMYYLSRTHTWQESIGGEAIQQSK